MSSDGEDRIAAALRTINFEVAAIRAAATERVEKAEAEVARLRESTDLGRHIRFWPAEDGVGNAVVCPEEPSGGCYWTLIGSGENADQNRIAQIICDRLNRATAAVNATAGIPTEALEAGIVGEMVEALKAIRRHIDSPAHYDAHVDGICEGILSRIGGTNGK